MEEGRDYFYFPAAHYAIPCTPPSFHGMIDRKLQNAFLDNLVLPQKGNLGG
jgi:hypothetical protein